MSISPQTPDVLEREFLELRARLLQAAAQLDRVDRAGGIAADDARLGRIHEAIEVLAGPGPQRAEQVQMIFSRPYDADWKQSLGFESS
jgi:hypothetical protein